ncbi:hypothetical protein [Aquitalea magnusonii]|uniref:hypothetical protein n=1 Tax=Aquitalea magnusonii TaxID=332411 RepID=UPI0011AE8287|nr:hypothetical protein [Aquitalea magnusonii]
MPVSLAPHYPESGFFPTRIADILRQCCEQQKDIAESCMIERTVQSASDDAVNKMTSKNIDKPYAK